MQSGQICETLRAERRHEHSRGAWLGVLTQEKEPRPLVFFRHNDDFMLIRESSTAAAVVLPTRTRANPTQRITNQEVSPRKAFRVKAAAWRGLLPDGASSLGWFSEQHSGLLLPLLQFPSPTSLSHTGQLQQDCGIWGQPGHYFSSTTPLKSHGQQSINGTRSESWTAGVTSA